MAPSAVLINEGNVVVDPSVHVKSKVYHGRKSAVLHRSLHQDPLIVASAEGNYLHMNNGQKIFDATCGAAVACLGHGNKR